MSTTANLDSTLETAAGPIERTIDFFPDLTPPPVTDATLHQSGGEEGPTVEVSELSAEETAYLRTIIRRNLTAEKESADAMAFIQKHKTDYKPCPGNSSVISQLLNDANLPFNLENAEKAYQTAVANGLLEMPTPGTIEEAHNLDTIRIQAQTKEGERIAAERDAQRQPIRTGLPASLTGEAPEETRETTLGDLSARLASMPLETARAEMTRLMHAARVANGSERIVRDYTPIR